MKTYKVRLFEAIPAQARAELPATKEMPGFAVEAEDIDGAMTACRARLVAWGHEVRAVSCLADNSADLAAVVFPKK